MQALPDNLPRVRPFSLTTRKPTLTLFVKTVSTTRKATTSDNRPWPKPCDR